MHRNYAAGRALTPATERLWMDVVGTHIPDGARTILDLGCGTGRFAAPIASRFPARVVGVDPSKKMLAAARRAYPCVRGAADRIPLGAASCDFVLLSMVVHHLPDLGDAAIEVARVLRPGGRALVRNCFKGRMEGICFFRFSPAALRAENARMPSIETVTNAFLDTGMVAHAQQQVLQRTDESLRAHYGRMRKRAMSTFELMTETEIEAGLAAMAQAVHDEHEETPVVEPIDVLVFERATSPT